MTFEIKESDIAWMKNLMRMLKVGGVWQTDFAKYIKTGENTLELVELNTDDNRR